MITFKDFQDILGEEAASYTLAGSIAPDQGVSGVDGFEHHLRYKDLSQVWFYRRADLDRPTDEIVSENHKNFIKRIINK